MRRLLLLALPASLLVIYACSSDSDNVNANVNLDAGPGALIDSGGVPVNDSESPDNDAGSDAGSTVVAKGPVTTCTALAPLSTRRAGLPFTTGSYNGKYLLTYGLSYTQSPDAKPHMLGRYFDGTSFGPEIDFGTDTGNFGFSSVDRTTGKEYLVHVRSGGALSRITFDLTTGTYASSDDTAFSGVSQNYDVGALPGGALAVFGSQTTPGAYVSHALPDGGWDDDAGVDGGVFSEAKDPDEAAIALNAAGKGAAWWADLKNPTTYTLVVLPTNGTTYGTPTRRDFSPLSELFSGAALSNGDVVFAWLTPNVSTSLAIFHPATGQWDADIPLSTGVAQGTGGPVVLVDANDTITVLWVGPSGYSMRRRIAGTWTPDILIKQATYEASAALDSAGNVIVVAYNGIGSLVTRMSPTDTTIGTLVSTGLGSSNLPPAVAFNAAGDPVVMGYDANGLMNTITCSK